MWLCCRLADPLEFSLTANFLKILTEWLHQKSALNGRKCDVETFGVAVLALSIGSSIALAEDMKLPPLKKQPTPQAAIDEHVDAL